jgi:hypothetical protein
MIVDEITNGIANQSLLFSEQIINDVKICTFVLIHGDLRQHFLSQVSPYYPAEWVGRIKRDTLRIGIVDKLEFLKLSRGPVSHSLPTRLDKPEKSFAIVGTKKRPAPKC